MVAPIDYTAGQAAPTDFLRSIQGGLQVGAQIQQQQQAAVQQQAAQAAAAAYSADAQLAIANPTPQAFAALALKYPSQREAVKQSWDGLSDAEKKSEGDTMSQAYAALLAGKPDVAKSVVQNQIDARKNTGLDTSHFDSALQLLNTDPQKAQAALGFTLSHIGDPKDFAAKFGALQGEQRAEDLAPAAVRSANAKAGSEESEAVQKRDSVIGSAAGALVGKGATVQQIQTMLKMKAKQGLIGSDDAQTYIDTIPTDPKAREDWLGALQGAGLKPEEQMKYTTPTADAALSSKTQIQTTSMNNATSRYATNSAAATAANRLAFDKDQAEPDAPPVSNGKSGADFLSSIDAPKAAQVKALAEGRMSFPTGNAAKTPYWQGMLNAVAQYDPSFDAVNYSARSKARNDLVAGKTGGNIKAINTAIAHMGQLNDQLSALKNSDVPVINTVRNWAAKNLGDSDRQGKLAAADATAEGVAGEMAKVFRETGMSEHEINAWRTKFGNSTTPAAQKGTMNSAMHMLNGRMEAIQDQYKTGMGTTAAPLDILTPQSKVIFNKLLGSAPPVQAKPPAPVAALPGGWTVKEH